MSEVAAATAATAIPAAGRSAWHDPSGFGFRDILDVINPLQHLPIIGSIYRWMTGDRPGAAAKIAGDALYGGPIGVGVGLLGAVLEDKEGHDLGERALAALFGPVGHATAIAAASAPVQSVQANAAAPPQATAAAHPVADHPPMPLYGGVAHPPAGSATGQDAARAFLAHNAALERQIAGPPRSSAPPNSTPVPLMLPAGALPAVRPTAGVAPANPGPPLDISQKMLDALDKYQRLEKERRDAGAAAPSVDLAL